MVVITAINNEIKIFCQINPSITDQLSATVAPLVGMKAFTKIMISGIMTNIKDNKIKGTNKTPVLLPLLDLKDLVLKSLESKFIRVPLRFV
jgi:hypothetical protein